MTGNSGERRCCLNDYTDVSVYTNHYVSVYTNRYVSSEGANFSGINVPETSIDPRTGYIDKEYVKQMVVSMCCSGVAMEGKVISNLMIPLNSGQANVSGGDPSITVQRWTYDKGLDSASDVGNVYSLVRNGVKWNNHIYCVPADFVGEDSAISGDQSAE